MKKDKLPKKIDSKELLLKNSGKLVDSINNLETYLKTNIFKGQNKNSESQEYYTFRKNKANLINQTYFDIYQILQSNNWIRKNPFENSYSNKFVESDMGGDIKLDLDNEVTIFVGARELYWHEMMNIEAYSFRKGIDDTVYLAGEQERREILRKAVLWVATLPDREFETNEDGQILSKLKFEIL